MAVANMRTVQTQLEGISVTVSLATLEMDSDAVSHAIVLTTMSRHTYKYGMYAMVDPGWYLMAYDLLIYSIIRISNHACKYAMKVQCLVVTMICFC